MIWKSKKIRRTMRSVASDIKRRSVAHQPLERRELLAADPIHVGVVYLETDYLETDNDVGSDSQGDRFILSFTGGAENTELNQLRIHTDKDGDGITVGDPIFDTQPGGRGKSGSHDFQVVRITTHDGREATAQALVSDGGQELILNLDNFRAGDRLEFTLDVDEVLRNSLDLAIFNDRLDVITSGQEFQDSILEAVFEAPHYKSASADAIFLNDFGAPGTEFGLDLPPDESDDADSRPNRSAAAIASTQQVPKPVAISGNVWLDNDLDAVRQADESGLSDVVLSLLKSDGTGAYVDTGHTTQTDSDGNYRFPKSLGLLPGNYRVVETQPDGLFSVAAIAGTVQGQATGTATSLDVLTDIAIPLGDTEAVQMNFAEAAPASISGYVYADHNDDGIKASDESPIAGVTLRLVPITTLGDQAPQTTITDSDGSYSFAGLSPGSYEVIEVNQPAGYVDGRDSAGTVNGEIIGIAENPGDAIRQIDLNGGDVGVDYNFGELLFGSLSGFVYLVAPGEDCDGPHDAPGNEPLGGVIVELQTPDGNVLSRVTTTPMGVYDFDEIPPGEYRVVQYTPSGLIDGHARIGMIDGAPVGTAMGGSMIGAITMTPGGIGVEYNFCEIAPVSLSGYVYYDVSDDGIRDPQESGIGETSISLIDSQGNVVATTATDDQGYYEFVDVPPGQYSLVEQQPSEYLDGIDSVGTVQGVVSGVASNDRINQINLPQGTEGTQYNFGERLPASLSGMIHVDTDGDCIRDDDEAPLANVVMLLIDSGGNEISRTTSDDDGTYRFTDLVPGRYSVVQIQPEGYFDGGVKAGSSGGAVGENRVDQIDLFSGVDATDYDFCEEPPASLAGSVFLDEDEDCIRDPEERGLEGVVIELRDASGNRVATTTTDASGSYRFEGLRAGQYTVFEQQPDGYFEGGVMVGSAGGTVGENRIDQIELASGVDATDYDFCEELPASLAGSVFLDENEDCIRDPDERGLEGVVIELRDASGNRVATTTTDASGSYRFEGLRAGQYTVFEYQPGGYFEGGVMVGSAGGTVGENRVDQIELASGVDATDYDFCEEPPASLAGSVFLDQDDDCIRDPDERGLEGVMIELRDASGTRVATATTDSNGDYRFDGLRSGQYTVFEYQPEGYFQGGQTLGSAGGAVVGVDLMSVTLSPGVDAVDYLFCEYEPSSISGSVWSDKDQDSHEDSDEVPLSGVIVKLVDDQGNVIRTTATDVQGDYGFDNLPRGVYGVYQQQPERYFHGGQLVGDLGGEVAENDLIVGIEIGSGRNGENYDFPEIPAATLSGFVFIDGSQIESVDPIDPVDLRLYRDGVFTADDTPLAEIEITIRDANGNPLSDDDFLNGTAETNSTVMTDASGQYVFTGLRPATYTLFQTQPADLFDSIDTPGSAGGLAVNAADAYNRSELTLIESVAGDGQFDAILAIELDAGSHSRQNNFSEVTIIIVPNRPLDFLRVIDRDIDTVPVQQYELETFTRETAPITVDSPPDLVPHKTYTDISFVTWHLSVINGGYPRGTLGDGAKFRMAAKTQMETNWSEGENVEGKWRLMTVEGEIIEASKQMTLGAEDAVALVGDFNGDGEDETAIYVGGHWYIDLNGNGVWDAGDLWILMGTEMDRPVIGDWDGDGKDDIGIYGRHWEGDPQRIRQDAGLPDPANTFRRHVENRKRMGLVSTRLRGNEQERILRRGNDGELRADAVDHVFQFGEDVDTPVSGDWNGDGIDQIGTFRGGVWVLDVEGDGRRKSDEVEFEFGKPGDQPIVGDFDGDGIDEVGIIRGNVWIIDSDGDRRLTAADRQIEIPTDSGSEQPIVGDWDGDGKDEPGFYRDAN